jgi:hypothetical protein
MTRVVVPPSAGLFSSFGLLYADVEHHYARSFRRLLRKADLAEIGHAWNELADQARAQLASEGYAGERARLKRSAALHYQGQSYELVVPMPDGGCPLTQPKSTSASDRPVRARETGERTGRWSWRCMTRWRRGWMSSRTASRRGWTSTCRSMGTSKGLHWSRRRRGGLVRRPMTSADGMRSRAS